MSWLRQDKEEVTALRAVRSRGDQMMTTVCWLLWLASVCFAGFYGEWTACLEVGLPLALLATALCWLRRGWLGTRVAIATIFMGFSAVMIDQAHGLIETHFSIFGLLAFLLYYRDWRPIVAAAQTIAVYHYVACELQMRGYGIYVFPAGHSCKMVWVHAAYVLIESAVLIYLSVAIGREAIETAAIAAFQQRLIETGVIDLRETGKGSARSKALDGLLAAINGAVTQASMAADGMGGMSNDVTEVAREILSAGQQQQVSSESTVGALQRMGEAAERASVNFNEVARRALASVDTVKHGQETIRRTAVTIEALVSAVMNVSVEMNELQIESKRIEGIIGIMSNLARQTELLALNATIEAARAGEAGKTFHVVAQEIRALSLRTRTSLELVQERVDQVRKKTSKVCAMTDVCAAEAQQGGQAVVEANATLELVVLQLPEIARQAGKVIDEARRYGELRTNAIGGMEGIERMIVANSSNLTRMDTLGQALQRMSAELIESVRAFRMREA